ncbi:prolipoprotein diacylglyceryl transferase [Sporosalibacterium faouarense]|uniref:prolipoprotein diacylglyceryl transferase n=1 Tax=Sporosalibacterium faouarense TaxID=516123 RepID=UPI00311CD54B
MVEVFKIGHYAIYLFGLTIVLGMIVGIYIMTKEAKRKGLSVDKLTDLAIYTIISAIVGARLYYVFAFNAKYYLQNPKDILALRDGGLSIQGALIFGVLFALWYTKKKNISFGKAADAFAPGIIMGQAIGRIGCDVFGIPMTKAYFWGVSVNNQLLHPAQIYEALLNLVLFTYLWKSRDKTKYNGQLFIKYIIGFSIIRGIVEFFRINPIVFGPFTIAHVTSLGIIVGALIMNNILKKRNQSDHVNKSSEAAITPITHYVGIILIGAIGIWIYYFVH